jgi:hypothetical protein
VNTCSSPSAFESPKGALEKGDGCLSRARRISLKGMERTWVVHFDSDAVADLFELRPKRGACEVRLVYARLGQAFVVLAIAAKKKDFGRVVIAANHRLSRYR